MATLNPYLHFNGNCEEAFEFYRSVFGGEFLGKSRFKDAPPQAQTPGQDGHKIMHVALPVGKNNVLMGSDCPPGHEVTMGSNVSLSLQTQNKAETDKLLMALAKGGKVIMPAQDMFWGAYFGMCIDRFGIHWMLNFDKASHG